MRETFGSLNAPQDWLSLRLSGSTSDFEEVLNVAIDSGLPLDVSHGKLVWGSRLAGCDNLLVGFGAADFHRAHSASDACILVSAQLVEWLSCLNGRTLDVFFLPGTPAVTREQWSGAIEAVETARDDGLIRFSGIDRAIEGLPGEWAPDLITEPRLDHVRFVTDTIDSRQYRLHPVATVLDVRALTLSGAKP